MKNQVLLTISGTIPANLGEDVGNGERPMTDYMQMSQSFSADVMDFPAARRVAGSFGKLLEKIGGPDLMMAWACFRVRKRYRVIFTDGENIGLPLATFFKFLAFGKRPRHLMIAHILSVPKKMLFLDRLGVQSQIDRFLVYSSWQGNFIRERWKLSEDQVTFTPFMVDSDFYDPDQTTPDQTEPVICAIGLERRDYPTLLQAVEGLPVRVKITTASLWSKRSDNIQGYKIPENVTIHKLSYHELRQLYADSRCLVMPLEDVNFQAGVTALLEAMAMERAVICSRIPGQNDVVVEGETGLYVEPSSPEALRSAIEYILAHPEEAAQMGKNGRKLIDEQMSLKRYAERLTGYVEEALAQAH